MTASLILASTSPRRKEILSLLGLPFTLGTTPLDEGTAVKSYQGDVAGVAQWLAEQKARAAAYTIAEMRDHVLVTADTTVLHNGKILGKPYDELHTRELLYSLRGQWHQVVTGVAVSIYINGELQIRSASRTTLVLMRTYSDKEVAAYIASGDPKDKAGGYSIQHPAFHPVERIEGCYLNVVGLPLCVLVKLLAEFHIRNGV